MSCPDERSRRDISQKTNRLQETITAEEGLEEGGRCLFFQVVNHQQIGEVEREAQQLPPVHSGGELINKPLVFETLSGYPS